MDFKLAADKAPRLFALHLQRIVVLRAGIFSVLKIAES